MNIHIAICTKDRYSELIALLNSLSVQSKLLKSIQIIDSSDNYFDLSSVNYDNNIAFKGLIQQHKHVPHLTAQRNFALRQLKSNQSTGVVIFLDDDVILPYNFIYKIKNRFESDTLIAGLTGIDVNSIEKVKFKISHLFSLGSSKPGKLLISGINTGMKIKESHYKVDWLPGCCMAFSLKKIQNLEFDENKWFWGEDVDFTARLAINEKLVCDPEILYLHKLSVANREHAQFAEIENLKSRIALSNVPKIKVYKAFICLSIIGNLLIQSFNLLIRSVIQFKEYFMNFDRDFKQVLHFPNKRLINKECSDPNCKIKSIVVKGGLGNQLFIYAYSQKLANNYNYQIVYDLSAYKVNSRSLMIDHLLEKEKITHTPINCPSVDETDLWSKLLIDKEKCVQFVGYFQNLKYFPSNVELLKKNINEVLFRNVDVSEKQSSPAEIWIAIHLRRGDFRNNSLYKIIDFSYYIKAVSYLRLKYGHNLEVIIFSDEIDEGIKLSQFISKSSVFNDNSLSPIEVMYKMTQASHFVLGNSTFGWWSAFLGAKLNSAVILPTKWSNNPYDPSVLAFDNVEFIENE